LGVRMGPLKALAKEVALDKRVPETQGLYHEETLLRGLVITYLKVDEEERIVLVEKFLGEIDNWSICDAFCSALRSCNKHKELYLPLIKRYIKDSHPYKVRFAVVMLLSYFLEKDELSQSLSLFEQAVREHYYVEMAIAWAVATAFTHHAETVKGWLVSTPLPQNIKLMAIQKIRDSKRTSKEDWRWAGELRKAIRS
ncbi:MAG: DNA alkylation repair protein, partial [Spirochaetales bacterium]|nr:DNA alkylation repair protein [Spirochaetales bacterium]